LALRSDIHGAIEVEGYHALDQAKIRSGVAYESDRQEALCAGAQVYLVRPSDV
jgi:hypothetical protein